MRALWFALPVIGLFLIGPAPAVAQINPFGDASKSRLSPSDFKMVGDTTERLLARPTLVPGTKESWTNPETKSTGSLTVKSAFHRKGFSCVAIRYQSRARGVEPNQTGSLNWCNTPDGWKIL